MAELLHIYTNRNSSIHYVFALHEPPMVCIEKLQKLPDYDIGLCLISYAIENGRTACFVCSPSKSLAELKKSDIIYCSFVRCLYKGFPLDFSVNFKEHTICFDYEIIDPSLERYIAQYL